MKLGFGSSGWSVFVVIALLLGSCTSPNDSTIAESPVTDEIVEPTAPAVAALPAADELTEGLVRLDGKATVEIKVGSQTITAELDGDQAPYTAGNFVDLAQKGVYDGTVFHRVVRDPQPFVVQGGDPQSTDPNVPTARLGTGGYIDEATGSERQIPLEILPVEGDEPVYGVTFPDAGLAATPVLNHRRGAIAMARSGTNTASAQFYIALADLPFLDGSYAVFGYVTDGMDSVDDIQLGDVITSVTVTSGGDNLVQPEATAE
ncbi:MAG: peptidylprolyl isomerase [Cyanobacteria bacterium J06629_19]